MNKQMSSGWLSNDEKVLCRLDSFVPIKIKVPSILKAVSVLDKHSLES